MPWKDNYTTSDEKTIADDALEWPGDARSAAFITVDLSLASTAEGVKPGDLKTDRATFGLNEGLDTVIDLLASHSLLATFAVPAVMASVYGARLVEIEKAGHEVAIHGFQHEDVAELSREQEAERMAAATDIVGEVTGHSPAGWYSLPRQSDPFAVGTISESTISLLAESGYQYFCPGLADDIPYYWVADFDTRTSVLTLPYYYHFDDQFFLMFPSRGTGLEHADALYANWLAEFDAQHERGRLFSMVLHPHAIAWCNRQRRLERFFEHLATGSGVWTPTGSECAAYWQERYPEAEYLDLKPTIWQDHAGSLS